VAPPSSVRDAIAGDLAVLRERWARARWTAPDTYHVTLHFIGPLPPVLVPALVQRVGEVAARHAPFRAATGTGGGNARGGREGVGWIEVGEGSAALVALATSVVHAAREVLDPDRAAERDRPHRPHITVVRRASSRLVEDLRAHARVLAPRAWEIDEVVLVRSHLDAAGARHEVIAGLPLAATGEREERGPVSGVTGPRHGHLPVAVAPHEEWHERSLGEGSTAPHPANSVSLGGFVRSRGVPEPVLPPACPLCARVIRAGDPARTLQGPDARCPRCGAYLAGPRRISAQRITRSG
jgi:RNA 2',3'-cyclic 3'-phosphodiesterase